MNDFSSVLKGKTVIVTGGTSGYGLEMAKALVSEGADVAVFSVDELPGGEASFFEQAGGTAAFFEQDILEPAAARIMVEKTVGRFGRLDHVIANAGFAVRYEEPLFSLTAEEIFDSMLLQCKVFPAAFSTLAVEAAKVMRKRYEHIEPNQYGHPSETAGIVVTLSEAALCPLRDDLLAYGAAKQACVYIMRNLAATLGAFNIRVNGIAPGFANTAGPKKFYDRYPNIKKDVEERNHLKPPFMHPGSVVPAVLYLLTDNYVTGETIALDGGYNINMVSYFQNS